MRTAANGIAVARKTLPSHVPWLIFLARRVSAAASTPSHAASERLAGAAQMAEAAATGRARARSATGITRPRSSLSQMSGRLKPEDDDFAGSPHEPPAPAPPKLLPLPLWIGGPPPPKIPPNSRSTASSQSPPPPLLFLRVTQRPT